MELGDIKVTFLLKSSYMEVAISEMQWYELATFWFSDALVSALVDEERQPHYPKPINLLKSINQLKTWSVNIAFCWNWKITCGILQYVNFGRILI